MDRIFKLGSVLSLVLSPSLNYFFSKVRYRLKTKWSPRFTSPVQSSLRNTASRVVLATAEILITSASCISWISKFSSIFLSVTSPNCKMGHNRRFFKVISIFQVVMSAIFLALGMVDRYEVRIVYTSCLFAPCWIAALVSISGSCLG